MQLEPPIQARSASRSCELCRFEHVLAGCAPESVRVDREVNMGSTSAFADIRVRPPGQAPYFVEVKLDYTPDHNELSDVMAQLRMSDDVRIALNLA